MSLTAPPAHPFWYLITRLGEAQILLPAVLFLCWALFRGFSSRELVKQWLLFLVLATLITTATKLAFIGWGIGIASIDFTGISGHSMFACAILPVLTAALIRAQGRPWLGVVAMLLGYALAIGVAWSRIVTGAHSMSEVAAGLAVGGLASSRTFSAARNSDLRLPLRSVLALALWLIVMPVIAPPSNSHDLVTRLARALSGHIEPFTRADISRDDDARPWP